MLKGEASLPPKGVVRVTIPTAPQPSNANIVPRYAIEDAAWVWHPHRGGREHAVLHFFNTFDCEASTSIRLHVSGDQRFEIELDGETMAVGPDCGEVEQWSFSSYDLTLEPGTHCLSAWVWWIGSKVPYVHRSHRSGFICKAEGPWAEKLDTGRGTWKVQDYSAAWFFDLRDGEPAVPQVGGNQTVIGQVLQNPPPSETPSVVLPPLHVSQWAGVRGGWKLHPSCLPEQKREHWRGGCAAALVEGGLGLDDALTSAAATHADIQKWQGLLDGKETVTIPPNSTVSMLWNLGDYRCAYSELVLAGGAGSEVDLTWAEAAFERPARRASKHKGHRGKWVGKYIRGPRDSFRHDGGNALRYRSCWWRSGRLILVTVRTADEALRIEDLALRSTGYPLEPEGHFASDLKDLDAIVPLCIRTLQKCAHEIWQDCPHYEQTMYVNDTRLHILATYTLQRDDRLVRRCIEIFDSTRKYTGSINASAPGTPQMLPTLPCYWPLILRDYALWRVGPKGVAPFMPGLRANMEWLGTLLNQDGLMEDLPGWPFIDTVPEWQDFLYGPDPKAGPPAIINLLYAYALLAWSDLEDWAGEDLLAQRARGKAKHITQAILEHCWNEQRGMIADYRGTEQFSEHAQSLALLGGLLEVPRANRVLDGLLQSEDLTRAQVFYQFYLFEALAGCDQGGEILRRLDYWRALPAQGFVTVPEMFEPSRSDCHAWGGHPLFHLAASIAGIRPAVPGFEKVSVAPSPGPLRRIECNMPHPRGEIETQFRFAEDGTLHASITLPDGVDGKLIWRGFETALHSGPQEYTVAPDKKVHS